MNISRFYFLFSASEIKFIIRFAIACSFSPHNKNYLYRNIKNKDIAKNKKTHQIRWAFSSAVYFTDAIRISPSNSYILYAIFLKKSTVDFVREHYFIV